MIDQNNLLTLLDVTVDDSCCQTPDLLQPEPREKSAAISGHGNRSVPCGPGSESANQQNRLFIQSFRKHACPSDREPR